MPDYANDILSTFIRCFCEKLFPHRDFNYVGIFDSKHRLESLIEIDDDIYEGSLRIEMTEDYKDFKLYEYDSNSFWSLNLKHTNLKMINVYLAYEHLNDTCTPFYIDIFKA